MVEAGEEVFLLLNITKILTQFFYCFKYNCHYQINDVSNAEISNDLGDIIVSMGN